MISAIVAVNNDWGIGYNGNLLEHIPEDLKYFKKLTSGNSVIMGRKTWNSLPNKPLPNRQNIVVTSTPLYFTSIHGECRWDLEFTIDMMLSLQDTRDYFIIGGGQIYKEFLPYCEKVYVTKIYKSHKNVDTYFPNLDELENWEIIEEGPIQTYKDIQYQFCQYSKIN